MRIRRAAAADAAELAALGGATFMEAFGHLYSPQDSRAFLADAHAADWYSRLLESPSAAAWLADVGERQAVAFVTAGACKLPVPDLEPRAGEIHRLYVLAEFQKHRLGTQLLEAALAWLEAQGREPVYLGVWSGNEAAQRLYRRYGFEKVGEYGFSVGQQVDREFIFKRARVRSPVGHTDA
jgi:ribosomal protein S18 acetylase RimI-like enzyme